MFSFQEVSCAAEVSSLAKMMTHLWTFKKKKKLAARADAFPSVLQKSLRGEEEKKD